MIYIYVYDIYMIFILTGISQTGLAFPSISSTHSLIVKLVLILRQSLTHVHMKLLAWGQRIRTNFSTFSKLASLDLPYKYSLLLY